MGLLFLVVEKVPEIALLADPPVLLLKLPMLN